MLSIQKQHILLGSKSPRRSFLLKESGFQFRVKTKDVDESYPSNLLPEEVAEYISKKKADAYRELLQEGEIGLVADTVVYHQGEILEKPFGESQAKEMLRKMSDSTHSVFTGVTLFDQSGQNSFTGHSEVSFLPLNEDEIDFYINTYQPYDKAGSYGIQEWIGYVKISKIVGSYTNIMGLPMELVYAKIQEFIK